jgi:outer membrane protein assembly factor BamB
VVVAFDKMTGKELWRALDANEIGYCPPTLIEAGGKKQLIIWHPDAICGLDPENGKVYWQHPLQPSFGMSVTAPCKYENYLFAAGIQETAALFELTSDKPDAKPVWHGKKGTAVYPVCGTPFIDGGVIYGVCSRGELRAVDLKTGDRLWETLEPTTGGKKLASASAFLVKNGDRFFLCCENGELAIVRLNRKGFEELSRCKLLDPTGIAWGRPIVWSHPAFANKCIYARNDRELICVSLSSD